MTPTQLALFALAHVLLLSALSGARGEAFSTLAAVCALASLIGLLTALDAAAPRRRP